MNFDTAFLKVVGAEGGYVNDPKDAGGETKFGVSKRAYPLEDIAALTLDRAKELYKRDYWVKAGCESVPDAIKHELFDMAVNQGVVTAIKALQHAVGAVEDGVLGPKTLMSIQSMSAASLLFRFDAARLVAYTKANDEQWLRFGRGWVRRVAETMMDE